MNEIELPQLWRLYSQFDLAYMKHPIAEPCYWTLNYMLCGGLPGRLLNETYGQMCDELNERGAVWLE